ncbi:MAG: hypothetical protein QM533_10175 [Cytophagales bacterium]|nr:hypothetical protein [Cytophagales bacterium]
MPNKTEQSQSAANRVNLFTIDKFGLVEEQIRIFFFKSNNRQLRKNGLPTLLSGMVGGGVKKGTLEAFRNGTGVSKETCVIAQRAINKLLLTLPAAKENGVVYTVPDTAIVPVVN